MGSQLIQEFEQLKRIRIFKKYHVNTYMYAYLQYVADLITKRSGWSKYMRAIQDFIANVILSDMYEKYKKK